MNIFDFLFQDSSFRSKDLILGTKETKSFNSTFEESSKLANYLRNRYGEEKRFMLVAQNSNFFILAYLGILKSGNICIPINPDIKEEGFEFIRKKTDSIICFFSECIRNRPNSSIEYITENILIDILTGENEMAPFEPEFNGDRLAEIIFTSGSTALPKGVMLSHNNIIANTTSIVQYLELSEKDIMMVVLPFYYCYGLSLLHTHIRVGGSLVLNNSFILLGSTVNDLNKYCCTGFAGVPSHFQILLRKSELFKGAKFPTLRYVTQAGGKLHNTFITEFIENFPEIEFFVMYGQSEATARLSYLPPELLATKLGSLGKGIPGVELKVINDFGKPIKPGEIGEILARGKNVMLGYFEDPEFTAETIKDGWLRTGDLATIDTDGYIYMTSRKKEIIKIGGKRISPKEVEEIIVMMNGVIDCTIESIADELLGEAIKVTVIVNEKGKTITGEQIKQHCGSLLSSCKIPSYVEIKEVLEISSTGKRIKQL